MSKLLRLPAVLDRTGLTRSSLYAKISEGTFCAPIKIGSRAIAFAESEVEDWIAARIAERGGQADAA
ncbi:helix-turn-helix transcriptional regulator [Sphingomicrobium marinum]|uniref:helix-turn-helix transcriptional regulator n=1 Tax=Sphingomicrobium marinum TaxID=1227950 RepID=UPI002240CAC0|nr:AlpA family transcriptional regulator [Sphingomicrobium marinum]